MKRMGMKGAGLSGYRAVIYEATGAPAADLARIENIMREEIFHSTLDWQTREQLAAGAREAFARLNEDRELYDLERECKAAMLRKVRAEAVLRGKGTAASRLEVARAEAAYQKSFQKLFRRLDGGGRN